MLPTAAIADSISDSSTTQSTTTNSIVSSDALESTTTSTSTSDEASDATTTSESRVDPKIDEPSIDSSSSSMTATPASDIKDSETESTDSDESVEDVPEVRAVTGNGSQSNPFTASNYQELSDAIGKTNASNISGDVYVRLSADITMNNSVVWIRNNKAHLIIDGAGHTLTYTGSTTTANMFRVQVSDKHVTFRNVNFGSQSSARMTYYGFCMSDYPRTILDVENVTYYADEGGQPFFLRGQGSELNFYGDNSFVVTGQGGANQEFIELAGTMNFKKDTRTSIVQKSREN